VALAPNAVGSSVPPFLKTLSLRGSPRGVSSKRGRLRHLSSSEDAVIAGISAKRGRLKRPSPSEDAVIARGLDWHYASAGSDFSEPSATKRTWVSSKSAPMLKSGAKAAR